MKATGIVRRIDDLGRVVIPKEIRRTMRIREGDPSLKTLYPGTHSAPPWPSGPKSSLNVEIRGKSWYNEIKIIGGT